MKPCRSCSAEVAEDAPTCPHCGASAPGREVSGKWAPCPKCGSAKTQRFGPGALAFISFVMGGCLLWIPIVGWVLAPFALLLALGLWIATPFSGSWALFQCRDCKHSWSTSP